MFLGFKIASSYYVKQGMLFKNVFNRQDDLEYIISLIENKYVDSIDRNKLLENGIEGIISSLDPHTVYIPPQKTQEVNEQLEGNLYGVGIEFAMYKDTARVLSILPNSPASKSAIRPGDAILKVDDSLIAGKNLNSDNIVSLIKGKAQTKVLLTLLHPNHDTEQVNLKRGQITINSIDAAYILPSNPDIGYIKIKLFSDNTYKEFKETLEKLKAQHIDKLIIDVRQNPGGYMRAVTNILDELIAGKHILLTTKSKSSSEIIESNKDGIFEKEKVCVLIDEGSASASEILAGAIQDLDRGYVIGSRSFGKGLVQEQFSLPNGGALRITVSRYYLPSGRCIQKDYSHGKEAYLTEVYTRMHPLHTNENDSLTDNKRNEFFTTKKRPVFGNEGITPDYEIIEDSIGFSTAFDSLYQFNLIEMFSSKFYFLQQNYFDNIKTVSDLIHLKISDSINQDLFNYIQKEIPSFSKNEFNKHQNLIDNYLLSEFALFRFSKNEEYLISGLKDKAILKAIDILNNKNPH